MARHQATGRWYLTSIENVEEFAKTMNAPMEMRNKMIPLMSATGEDGHNEEYFVDYTHKAIGRKTYCHGELIREFMAPMDIEVPGWSLNGKMMKYKMSTEDTDKKITRMETGEGYTMKAVLEITGDNMTTTWTIMSPKTVTAVLKFKRRSH